ncbi:MAG: hypothetical protein COA43_04655 [Robiginitomaculum sp.]|nr:MAG: hypothetical protein COA43_04655 [Robiginitomaculum sp.]
MKFLQKRLRTNKGGAILTALLSTTMITSTAHAVNIFNASSTNITNTAGVCKLDFKAQIFNADNDGLGTNDKYKLYVGSSSGGVVVIQTREITTAQSGNIINDTLSITSAQAALFQQGSSVIVSYRDGGSSQSSQIRGRAQYQSAALRTAGGVCLELADTLDGVGVNAAPVANAGVDQTLLADFSGNGTAQTVTLSGLRSSDPDGDTLTYAWTQISGPTTSVFSSQIATSQTSGGTSTKTFNDITAITYTQPASAGTVVYRLTVTDPSNETHTDDVSVTWNANAVPTTTAPATQSPTGPVLAGSTITLSSGTSTDPDGGSVTYTWVQTGGPTVTLDNPNAANPSFTVPATGGTVIFTLTVSDGVSTTTKTVTSVIAIDQTPVANAGVDQTLTDVARGTVVTLDGTASIDPDGGALTYAWTQVSGPAVTLSSATAAQPTFTYPASGEDGGGKVIVVAQEGSLKGQPASTLVFELIVSDGSSSSAGDQVSITINTNDAPTADAGVDQTLYGLDDGTVINLDGTGSSDPDGDTLTYTWTQTSGPTVTLTSPTTATPSFTHGTAGGGIPQKDINSNVVVVGPAPVSNDVNYAFSLVVSDGSSSSAADTVGVDVLDNRVPTSDAGSDQANINAGETVTLDGTGSADADGDTLTYTWRQVSGPTATLSSTSTAQPTFTAPDISAASTLVYELIVSDGKISSAADTVSIGVQPTGSITIIQSVQGSDNSFAYSSSLSALNASIQTSNGTGQLLADDVNTGTYTVTAADMKSQGYALTALSCNDGDGSVDLSAGQATIALAPGENVTCTFTSVNSREAASKAIREFVTTRNTLILSHQPSRGRRIDRLKGQSALGSVSAGGFALPGSKRLPVQVAMNGGDASFATSLSSARAVAGSRNAGKSSIDVWGEAYLSNFDAAGRDGHFSIMYGGVDYLVSDKVLVGGLVQLDKFKQSGINGVDGIGAGDGAGFMVGPYVTTRLSDNIYVDARAAWGSSKNTISPLGTFTDEFDTKRALYSGSVTGEVKVGKKSSLQPALTVRHISETQKAYTDKLGVVVPEQDISQGEVSFAPRFVTNIAMKNGWQMRPHATVEGIYAFGDHVKSVPGSETRARVEGGVDWQSNGGVTAGIAVFADGLGAKAYKSQSIRFTLSYTMK